MGENRGNLIFISGVVGLILLMVLPIPTIFLDTLLATNLAIALTVIIVSLYMKRPLDFSAFPALLLMTTLFRLTLNIASTRLILFFQRRSKGLQELSPSTHRDSLTSRSGIPIWMFRSARMPNQAYQLHLHLVRQSLETMPGQQ